jgi:hypothetical protein
MKRIKIMLLSLLLIGTVGAGLAYKVKGDNFCVYKIRLNAIPLTCPRVISADYVVTTTQGIYSFKVNNGNCPTVMPTTLCTIDVVEFGLDF